MSFKKLKVARMLGGALGLLLALNLVLVPAPALAVEGIPHWFKGTVTIDGELAPEGTIISAQIEGIEYASAQVDAAGRYGLDPLFYVPADDPDTPEVKEGGVTGDTVEFYITNLAMGLDEVKANETALFENFGVTELNLTVGEAPAEYTLTVASTTGGSVTEPVDAISTYDAGTVVDLLAVPDTDYEFLNWTGDVDMVTDVDAADTTITMNGDYSITANFALIGAIYNLTVASSAGGSVTEPGEGVFTRDAGTVVDLLAVPDADYEFLNWTGDVDMVAAVDAADTTITMNSDYSITANFALIGVTYTLTVASTAGGSVTEPVDAISTYDAGTVVDLLAVPDTDYEFLNWTGDVDMVTDVDAADTTITMNGDYSITANFALIGVTYALTMAAEPEIGGTATDVTGLSPYEEGASVSIKAEAAALYQFVNWTATAGVILDATQAETTFTMPGEAATVTANFTELVVFTTPLSAGWNLLSTPILLEADSDTLEQILGVSLANIDTSYRWDAVNEQWAVPTGYELSPLEAVYLKVKADASATAEFIPSQELSWPPSRELQQGLNLIGPAPALEAGVFPDIPLDLALVTIEEAPDGLTGYTKVVSPAHNQPGWVYPEDGIQDLLPYKGYWVVMLNAGYYVGSSTTPIE